MTKTRPSIGAAALAAILTIGTGFTTERPDTLYDRFDDPPNTPDGSDTTSSGTHEQFDDLKAEAQAILDKAKQEDRELTDDEKEQFDSKRDQLRRMKAANAREKELNDLNLEVFANKAKKIAQAMHNLPGSVGGDGAGNSVADTEKEKFDNNVKKFEIFVRTGQRPEYEEHEEFTITTSVDGGVLVPRRVADPMVVKRTGDAYRLAIASRGVSPVQTDSTALIEEPLIDDTANTAVENEDEGDRTEKEADPAITHVELTAPLFRSKAVWFSNTQLATQTNLLPSIEPQLYRRIDRVREASMTTKITTNATKIVTGAATDGITFMEVLQLQHAIPRAHRASGVFVVSDQLALAIRGLEDSQGRPLYVQSIKDGEFDRLAGWPIFIADSLPAPAANAKTLVAASAEALRIRDVTGGPAAQRMARYTGLPDHPDQVGMELFENGSHNFHNPFVAVFRQAAS
ncbi:MAG: phage major capsid protein [Planctomycetota bacterium]